MTTTEKNRILYHGKCTDGICAAAIVHKFLREETTYDESNNTFIPMQYGDGIDMHKIDKDTIVWIVDFSPTLGQIVEIDARAKRVMWFDHHATAMHNTISTSFNNTIKVFDINRCGAQITWDEIYHTPRPEIVDIVGDRDRWIFKLPNTKPVTEGMHYLITTPLDPRWEELLDPSLEQKVLNEFFTGGQLLLKAKDYRIENALKRGYYGKIKGHKAFYVNASEDISEIGERIYLSHNTPIVAVMYSQHAANEFVFSLRSNTINVREIAQLYGGGGHDYAAGFKLLLKNYKFNQILGNVEDIEMKGGEDYGEGPVNG